MESIRKQLHYFIHGLARIRLNICEYFRIKFHYGWISNFISKIQEKNFRFWRKCSDGQKSSFYDLETTGKLKNQKENIAIRCLNNKITRIKELYQIDNNVFDKPVSIAIISYFLPRYDRTSADHRLREIIRILLANKCKIHYIYCSKTAIDPHYKKALNGDIHFRFIPLNLKVYEKAIYEIAADYVFITNLWQINYLKFMTKLAKKIKHQDSLSKIIIDTMDFHYKEFIRKYRLSKEEDDRFRALEFLKYENILYKIANTVIVVSDKEKGDIKNYITEITNINIIPNIHYINEFPLPFESRRNICFVGNFGNRHNIDAVLYFIESIFPLILEKNTKIKFHIIGNRSEKLKRKIKAKNVKVVGFVNNLEKILDSYKLFVCPMTYGTGMKGKIGMAAALGLPIVTTSIGAEGFPVTDGVECFIADSPPEFAEKCNQCLNDPILWHNFSLKGKLMLAENFSPGIVAGKLKKVLSD